MIVLRIIVKGIIIKNGDLYLGVLQVLLPDGNVSDELLKIYIEQVWWLGH